MEVRKFGDAFRKARVARRITIREVADHINRSISYVSDIEHNRKPPPPDLDTIRKIEELLNLKEGSLVEIALRVRKAAPLNLAQRIRSRPVLSEVLLRADNLSDEKINELLSEMEKKEGE